MTRKQVFGAICLAGVLLFALSFGGCGKGGAKGLSETRDVLGTKVTISIFDQGMKAGDAKAIFDESFNMMADWQKKTLDPGDGNQVFGLSKGAGTQSIPVDPPVFEMLMKALRLYDQTGKIFDIRYGPMLDVWGFDTKPRVPAPAELDTAKKLVADGGMFIAGNSILLARKGMRFDVREITVGHAFDMVANKLAERGIRTASITSPRICRAIGDPPNKRGFEWKIENPTKAGQPWATVWASVGGTAYAPVSTGRFESGGKVYNALLDPRTGLPVADRAGAIVQAPDAATPTASTRTARPPSPAAF
jgi:thiamine biosynthesis lipoprotein